MEIFFVAGTILAVLLIIVLLISLVCFFMAFYSPKRNKKEFDKFSPPVGKIYEPYYDMMKKWTDETNKLCGEEIYITSYDGLKLFGKFYEYEPGAPIELMMPGYRGLAQRDLCGGVQRCFSLGRSALAVEQRGCGRSKGHVITFGVRESRDCLSWMNYLIARFGKDTKIFLTGISMGASTVMLASGTELPENVVGVIADCGYSSAPDIIKKVIGQMKLPVKLFYPFVRLGAILYGHFDPNQAIPSEALKKCRVPVFFAHGDADDYVPAEMSKINFEACQAPKKLLLIPGAGHGLGYVVAPEEYRSAIRELFDK